MYCVKGVREPRMEAKITRTTHSKLRIILHTTDEIERERKVSVRYSSIAAFFSISCQSRAIFVNVLLLAVDVDTQRTNPPGNDFHIPKMFKTSRRSSRLWNPSNVGVHESSLPGRLAGVINPRFLINGPMGTHQYNGPNISLTSSSALPRNPSSAIRFA